MSSSSASMFAIAPIPFPVGKTTRGDGAPDAGETESNDGLERLKTLGCERLRVAGTPGSLYERHLIFDKAIAPSKASARDRFDAFAQAVRDVVNARWLATDETYEQDNPKRIYYLSMEFLIGRSLANNVTNLLAEGIADRAAREEVTDWSAEMSTWLRGHVVGAHLAHHRRSHVAWPCGKSGRLPLFCSQPWYTLRRGFCSPA